ncbi:beta-defensin 109-like isoform X2 [Canis lupus baileyi]|uniref:beta-defensin 109 isoform X2 n=1 Tax=Canis lupus dingo TaxID=286419 RepID=UPI000DC6C49C|nr:beta-defensin 109 isoform X2 [Canis lupus dingo]XP_025289864.1 beta-defensin 109 isoform X2 [Canis lupus dingo]XP_025289865.1 beta-defensin 109 isoform X2 [Canis lupus dingo]XP_025289866.1 beta-defensin 109 isoform X2 [Canis lupus dingo]XP_025289867.1 beta-defensin 109 isoform X2 [Canis lupus dingo]XP_038416441.1 putative beta-defensin 109B isoform X2 [Canis lupus familiaris]XP_038416442.1 putative beta-defensin 109B isoform X2 [Canis lupus familiaris]XP_038416443.1 putative beta-defensin
MACEKKRRMTPHVRRFQQRTLLEVRSGLASGENHCLNLSGVCRRDICKMTEDQIGACKRRWVCCRAWWILIPIPTPLIYSDYQEPLKPKLK